MRLSGVSELLSEQMVNRLTSASTGECRGARVMNGSASFSTEPTDSFASFNTTASSGASNRTRSLCLAALASCCRPVSRALRAVTSSWLNCPFHCSTKASRLAIVDAS